MNFPIEFAVVIPTTHGREENLTAVLRSLNEQTKKPKVVVLVFDGGTQEEAVAVARSLDSWFNLPTIVIAAPKHQPGDMQPRNRGARAVEALRLGELPRAPEIEGADEITHVAFLDSDIIFSETLLECYERAIEQGGADGVWYGPYEWLPPGKREIDHEFFNDPRWEMFRSDGSNPTRRFVNDLSKGLGCFSGNLVWNLSDFAHVGGFWDEIHHGRCEDGELGARAVAMGVPIGLVPEARGWHLDHPRNYNWIEQANARDVPMLNERHPWLESRCTCTHAMEHHATEAGSVEDDEPEFYYLDCQHAGCECECFEKSIFVVEEDGKRFDARCACGWTGNTALIWAHQAECPTHTTDWPRREG